jgi:hypothetical protein
MLYNRLYQGQVRPQGKKVRESIETYIYELKGSLHAGVEGPDLFLFGLGIHGHQYILTNMESSLNEVQIVPQGLYNTRILSRLFPKSWHR